MSMRSTHRLLWRLFNKAVSLQKINSKYKETADEKLCSSKWLAKNYISTTIKEESNISVSLVFTELQGAKGFFILTILTWF